MRTTEVNEKVLAIYQAVWALIDEGRDIHRMKVSDITERAGIGKGTAYEYFRSKEEILGSAMAYDFLLQYTVLEEMVRSQDNFRDAMKGCFSFLMENRNRRRFTMQFVKQEGFKRGEDEKGQCDLNRMGSLLSYLTELGKKDGFIPDHIPEGLASTEIFAQMLAFFMYQESRDGESGEDMEEAGEFFLSALLSCMQERSGEC